MTAELFVGFFDQLFSDKRVTTLKSTPSIAYPVHAILFSVSARRKQCLKGNVSTLVVFLLVCCTRESIAEGEEAVNGEILVCGFTPSMTVPLESGAQISADSKGRA